MITSFSVVEFCIPEQKLTSILWYEVESEGGSCEFHFCFAVLKLWNVCSE